MDRHALLAALRREVFVAGFRWGCMGGVLALLGVDPAVAVVAVVSDVVLVHLWVWWARSG